ncbi:MAG: phage portal protein [Planctomycetota bacterium]|nr:MAG: phage portal protein [Planctomycetota bacterium]
MAERTDRAVGENVTGAGGGGPRRDGLSPSEVERLLAAHQSTVRPRLDLMWRYYRNPLTLTNAQGSAGNPTPAAYDIGQRSGLPARLVGRAHAGLDDRARSREIVIENDIAWRIHTMVDFMFGKPVRLVSTARDEATQTRIERMLDAVWEGSGGIALLQDMALLGHVYGHVDLVLRIDEARLRSLAQTADAADPWHVRECIRVEVIEPTRGVPVVAEGEWRELAAYIIHAERESDPEQHRRGPLGEWLESWRRGRTHGPEAGSTPDGITEVIESTSLRVYIDGELVEERELSLTGGRVPVVHVQNVAQPFRYGGLSEVEPLIPLQDELNTRLSDRASRVTLQSFKMYLAKGIEGFETMPVGPGQIWSTDNPDASVSAFGGDASSPSEESHIREVRDAMDKTSGVPPLATGVVQGRVGNLSSANALKITLVGLLAKTERKRVSYGRGLEEMSRLVLTALDAAGVMETDPRDRSLRLVWPDPLPTDVVDETLAAKRKIELGVPTTRVLDELGYEASDPGVV